MMPRSILILAILLTSAGAIVPPKVPGLKIPAAMLANIREDPGCYMPGVAFTGRMQHYREQKLALAKTTQAPDTVVAYLPVLCMQYADVDSEWAIIDMAEQLFGNWSTGSMTDYYREVSYGDLEVTGEVYGWVQVSGDKEYYDRDNGHTGELIREALDSSDTSVDYSLYDNDGPDGIPNSGDDDGYVDTIVLIHSGTGGEYGGPEIWSHSWSLTGLGGGAYTTDDPSASGGFIKVDGYIIQPAVGREGMEEIGVFCHEFGHALGLPDLYDRDGSSEGVGNWCLMAGGGSESWHPSHMSAWCKEIMGWITPEVLTGNLYDQPIPAVEDTAVVYKLWTHGNIEPCTFFWGKTAVQVGREYFLVENRKKLRFDDQLPGEGLLIWHIQNSVLTQNDDENNKLVDLEAADHAGDLDQGRGRGDDGDPFPGTSGNRAFNRASRPNSNTQGGEYSKVAVADISDPGLPMYADLFPVAPDLVYLGNTVDDASGNGDGYADPGETVNLQLSLLNLGSDIPGFVFTLSTTDPSVTILDNAAAYQDIPEDSTITATVDDFQFSVAGGTACHPLIFTVQGTDNDRHTETYEIVVMMENLAILVVDDTDGETDDAGIPLLAYHTEALDFAGIPYYSTWSRVHDGLPDSTDLSQHRTVVWINGSNQLTLSADEQTALGGFLDGGGSLFITGQNLGRDLVELGGEADSVFYTDYLRASYVADNPDSLVRDLPSIIMTGVADDPISQNFYGGWLYLTGGNSAENQTSLDIIVPMNGAVGTIEFFGTYLKGYNPGIRYEGDYRLVYLTFGIEGINENNAPVTRAELVQRVIWWLQEDDRLLAAADRTSPRPEPRAFSLRQNYPNPFNAATVIPYAIDGPGPVELVIYNVAGREVSRYRLAHAAAGEYALVWNGLNERGVALPSGVYFYSLRFRDQQLVKKMVLLR